ncbi:N-6 DNA methylase [Streptomyces sp. NPDC085937]|uniref:N-6 DNA methylase n=1 Tax=Streptomyces sp. NPDC085937 TaxID=3365742 RepID=UPI0037D92FA3
MTDFLVPTEANDETEFASVLVSRPEIARLAGVKRPAVTNWERRHPDFPRPVTADAEIERFLARDVADWLSARAVPANARRPGEPAGTTYGDRFRAGLSGGTPGGLLRTVERLAGPEADRLRGPMTRDRYLWWLLWLVLDQVVEPDGGLVRAVDHFRQAVREHDLSQELVPGDLLNELVDTLGRTPRGSEQESQAAFDHVLVLWRAAHAREGGAFFTPPSVSRVMAGALAAVHPGARSVHDPYGRTGELLVAYLDAVIAQGADPPPHVGGRVPDALERQVAEANLRVHHGRAVRLDEGAFAPALALDADPVGAFDVLLTNPPFGRRLENAEPPPHWIYGPARRSEFDWLQYVVSRLAPGGRAAVLMPAGASFNAGVAETVRAGLVEARVVECVIALPPGLFTLTAVKTHIWFLRAPGTTKTASPEVLFVSGEHLGRQVGRTQWSLTDDDITLLVGEYTSWCSARKAGHPSVDTPGLSRAVQVSHIADQGHSLDPARYVRTSGGGRAAAPDPIETRDRLARLAEEIESLHTRAAVADADATQWLRRYGL